MTWREKLRLHKRNPLAALYPSSKLLVVLLYSFCTMLIGTIKVGPGQYPLWLMPWFLVVPVLCAASGIFQRFCHAFTKVLAIVVIIFIVQSLLIPDKMVVWQLGFLKVYHSGLQSAIYLSFCILNIAGIFVWMFQTTEYKEMSRALEDSGMDYKAAYVFISTLQMINILGKNSRTIMNAQRARGVETQGNMLVRAKAFFPSLVPLILGAITNSEERVLTLESKGFDVKCKKTHLFELERTGKEPVVNVISIIITLAVVVWRVALWVL